MANLDWPVEESRPGRCAAAAQDVAADDERPMSAVRRGWGWGAMMSSIGDVVKTSVDTFCMV